MYLDGATMSVEFKDSSLETTVPLYDYLDTLSGVGLLTNSTIKVNSADTNFKQTVEIEVPKGYTEQPNKILVVAARYTEIAKGDFLEADYDETLLAVGEVPRKLTRVVGKTQYAKDTSLVEITCDAKIKKLYTGAMYQTMRYKKVDYFIILIVYLFCWLWISMILNVIISSLIEVMFEPCSSENCYLNDELEHMSFNFEAYWSF